MFCYQKCFISVNDQDKIKVVPIARDLLELGFNILSTKPVLNQLSVFYGSQKGGLGCANGSCVIQPDFEDGLKLTYRTSF